MSETKGLPDKPGRPWPLLSMVILLGLPFASPFVVGTSAGAGSNSPVPPTLPNLPSGSIASSHSRTRNAAGVSVEMSAAVSGRKRRLLSRLTPSSGSNIDSWRGGDHNSTLFNRLLFRYTSPLLDLAKERQLDVDDAFEVPKSRQMGSAVPDLARIYDKCRSKARRRVEKLKQEGDVTKVKSKKTLTLAKALLLQQRRILITTGILRLVNTAVQAFPAVLVARLLRLIEAGDENPPSKAVGAAASLIAVLLIKMIVENQYFHHVVNCATQVRGSLAGLIFDKSLRLPSGSAESSVSPPGNSSKKEKKTRKKVLGAGEVMNLMQSDASLLESAAMQLHTIWDGPLQIAVYTTLLFKYLGKSVLWGLGVLLLTIPLNSVTLRFLNRLTKLENKAKDARTKRTAEAISHLKLLKLQGWEETFADDIRGHRSEELRRHVNRGLVRALNSAISNAVPALTLVVTLTAYAKTGRPIVASTIFTAISLFNQLRFPLFFYPMLLDSLANGTNALKRVSSYLSSEEITPYVQKLPLIDGNGGGVSLKKGNFLWSASSRPLRDGEDSVPTTPALCDVDLQVRPGEVVAIVGPVGSGKTALVKSILGELAPVPRMVVDQSRQSSTEDSGSPGYTGIMDVASVATHGDIAYFSQDAWLPKGTIRDAVVFGREYDEDRYMAALRDAGLDSDIVDDIGDAGDKEAASSGVLSHETDVGEGGSSLSGGQRARVALARALYASDSSKVFLLDDPLAALDASVGSTVFERMTKRLRSANVATLLVTNDPSIPRRCDRVVLMGKYHPSSPSCSTIIDVGTYDELLERGHDLSSLASPTSDAEDVDDMESEEDIENAEDEDAFVDETTFITNRRRETIRVAGGYEIPTNKTSLEYCHADPDSEACSMEHFPDYVAEHVTEVSSADDKEEMERVSTKGLHTVAASNVTDTVLEHAHNHATNAAPNKRAAKKLASADDAMSSGAVPRSTYLTYIKSVGSPWLIAAMISSYLFANGAQFYQQYIVAKWTEIGRGDAMAAALGGKYLRSLVNAAGVVSVFMWLRSYFTMHVGVRASKALHNRMLSSVFRASIAFFDSTPSGQLLSRFGKEMETVDRALPDGIGSVFFCFLQIALSGMALTGVITPVMLLPLMVIGYVYYGTMTRFRPAARDLKRSESKTRSPIYTHFGEALRGTETIRSIPNAKANWSTQHRSLTDENLSVFYAVKALDRWLSIRLETLGNAVVFASAVASVFLTRVGKLKAGSAGWGLTQALSITGLLTWAVRVLTDLETQMMSVSRVKELTDLDSEEIEGLPDAEESHEQQERMPKEKAAAGEALEVLFSNATALNITVSPVNDTALAQDGWPWNGGIKFNNVSMRYNAISPLVLNGVSIAVPPGTTLGVVGRTGSGKSSLLLTLFRLVELEPGGSIEIDGVDIRSVSLQTLRESLSIIPQDPVLFAGTVMYNLDATGRATEEAAWEALDAASPDLAQQFRNAGTGLNTLVSEGGKNLSSGQRQLLCLARALLRKSKILVLDEATSSIDYKTDAQVQATIKREFVDKGVTVVTVAHRLDTVLGYDRIAVLGNGELLEYGTPGELLQDKNGELRRLVEAYRENKKGGSQTKKSDSNVTSSTPMIAA